MRHTSRLDEALSAVAAPERPRRAVFAASTLGALARFAGALAVAGVGFLTVAESAWAHGVGVACLLGFVAVAFVAVAPAELAAQPVDGSER